MHPYRKTTMRPPKHDEYDKYELKRKIDKDMEIFLARGGEIEKIGKAWSLSRDYFTGTDIDDQVPGED